MRVMKTFVCLFVLTVAVNASAQASRTWLSGLGDDANPCSFTAPCKTFNGAYSKTAVAGQISVMDAGAYGTIYIDHSITIDGGGNFASGLVAAGTGVRVNMTSNDLYGNSVIIRGLSFDSSGAWGYGMWVTGTVPTNVHLEDVTFTRAGTAVQIDAAAGSSLRMNNVEASKPISYGFVMNPAAAGAPLKISLNNVRVSQAGQTGLLLSQNTNGVISNSLFQNNKDGVIIGSSSVHVSLVRTVLSSNVEDGLTHSVAGITTVLDGCSIFSNGLAGVSNTGSTVLGLGNNGIAYNGTDVSGNPIQPLQPQ